MKKRLVKKRVKEIIDCFTGTAIAEAFCCESERIQYVRAFARRYVGQKSNFPENSRRNWEIRLGGKPNA